MAASVGVGLIGCGYISDIYLKNLTASDAVVVRACADLLPERAQARAAKYGVAKACAVEELLADPEIEIVLNLTVPKAHYAVALAALEAGKSVHNEKPLALTRAEGKHLLDLAAAKGVLLGCAPDTFMGGGLQTCRKLIDDGVIGEPLALNAFMQDHGTEGWHPDPEFYYEPGGGPMFDMGPYYLTAMVAMLGPVRRVTGSARISQPERLITSQPKAGTRIPVQVPTHISTVLDFVQGAVGTLVTSFDCWGHQLPHIEIYGSEGTLSCPDPNYFGGPVRLRKAREREWQEVPLAFGHTENSRGIGVLDMAEALRTGRLNRANGQMAYHVLDIMHAVHDASETGQHVLLESTCERPLASDEGLVTRG
ncbi:MAG: oxidoreductase [Chloroflexi bacterium]|nr:MAG: oxidoreductase [Chloroflexota bacterium]